MASSHNYRNSRTSSSQNLNSVFEGKPFIISKRVFDKHNPIIRLQQRKLLHQKQSVKEDINEKLYEELRKQDIPLDPQAFYEDFGFLTHRKTKQPVTQLTPYQKDVWEGGFRYKYRLVIKSQKIGLSTTVLMEDFQRAITTCRGGEILIIAQSFKQAQEHIYTLRRMISSSEKYSKWLITKPTADLLKSEVSNSMTLYIRNTDNPKEPTRIIAIGNSESAVWSWKNVMAVHFSDIAISTKDYTGLLDAGITRLAISEGPVIVETPPAGPTGKLYEIYKRSELKQDDEPESQFKIWKIPAREAIPYNIISQQELDELKIILGDTYAQYFNAEFVIGTGNLFRVDKIDAAQLLGKQFGINMTDTNASYDKYMGIDPAWGSSKFGIIILENRGDGIARVVYAQEFKRPIFKEMIDEVFRLRRQFPGIFKYYVDAANSEFISSLKDAMGEATDYESILHDKAKKFYVNTANLVSMIKFMESNMDVVPISSKYNQYTLSHIKDLVEREMVAIHPDSFRDLLDQMLIAKENNHRLEKTPANQMDLLDALRLASVAFRMTKDTDIRYM